MKNYLIPVLLFCSFLNLNAQIKHTVIVRDFEFVPQHLNITLGDTVMWQWQSGVHTTTSNATSGPDSWNEFITSASPTFSFVISNEGVHGYYCIPHEAMGMTGTITVTGPNSAEDETNFLGQYQLGQNYPNPFNPSTSITFRTGESGHVTLAVYNSLGNELITLVDEYKNAGTYSYSFNAENLASGVYYYKLFAGNFIKTMKMLLLK
jgi:plastocyanin